MKNYFLIPIVFVLFGCCRYENDAKIYADTYIECLERNKESYEYGVRTLVTEMCNAYAREKSATSTCSHE